MQLTTYKTAARKANKTFAGLIALSLVFVCAFFNVQEFLVSKLKAPAFIGYIDEAFLIVAYCAAIFAFKAKIPRWLILIFIFPVVSVIGTLLVNVILYGDARILQAVVQSFINIKLFTYLLLFLIAEKLFVPGTNFFKRLLVFCLILTALGAAFNLLSPADFEISEFSYDIERGRIIGFQYKPNDMGVFCSFAFVYFLLLPKKKLIDWSLLVMALALVVLSTSRTGLSVLLIAVFLFYFRKKYLVWLVAFFVIFLAALPFFYSELMNTFFVKETLSNFSEFQAIENSQYIRFIMLYYGLVVGVSYFPIGAGAGNFGTVMSMNSPVYQDLGLSGIDFFQEFRGIYDSNLASVVGEYGLVGVIFFGYLCCKFIGPLSNKGTNQKLILYSVIIAVCVGQPFFSYQVNSVNFLMLVFGLRALEMRRNSQALVRREFVSVNSTIAK